MRDNKSLGPLFVRVALILVFFILALLPIQRVATATGLESPRPESASRSGKTALLESSRAEGSIDRITVKLDAGGELKFVEDKKVGREKMSVVAELSYTEKTLALPKEALPKEVGDKDEKGDRINKNDKIKKGGEDTGAVSRSVRYYDRAEAIIKVGDGGFKPTLREQCRLIGASAGDSATGNVATVNGNTLFSPMGPLSRDELDLLNIDGNSLLLDRLLPKRPIAEGDDWEHSESLMTALLGLDKIAKCNVKSKLEKLSDGYAMMVASGRVEGAIGGVSTKMDVKAKYRFNRGTGRIDWFGLLVKEDRDIGHINTGVELVARVQMQIKPIDACPQLADAALKGLSLVASEEVAQLLYRSKAGGWEFSHDRRWFVTADERSRAVFRLVDAGELIAQCNVTALSKTKPGGQVTLEQFQSDIKEALGESFGEFINASQRANEANYRIFRVVAEGESSELPIRWIYYLIVDEQGRQVAITFTVEKTHVQRLAGADHAVIETLRFTEPEVAERTNEKSKR